MFNAVALEPKKEEGKGKKDEDAVLGLFTDTTKRHLVVCVTTDRGLCGAVNSSLSRALRKELNAAQKAKADVKVITLGDKGRAQIAREYTPMMALAVDQCFDKDPVFPLAAAIAAKVVSQPYDLLTLWFNHYENQAKFVNTFKQIPQLAGMKAGESPAKLKGYEVEPKDNSETLVNLQEYAIASAVFYAMLETAACETSQRVMAMDNATTVRPPARATQAAARPAALPRRLLTLRHHASLPTRAPAPAERQGHGARPVSGVQPRAPGQDHDRAVRDHRRRGGAGGGRGRRVGLQLDGAVQGGLMQFERIHFSPAAEGGSCMARHRRLPAFPPAPPPTPGHRIAAPLRGTSLRSRCAGPLPARPPRGRAAPNNLGPGAPGGPPSVAQA